MLVSRNAVVTEKKRVTTLYAKEGKSPRRGKNEKKQKDPAGIEPRTFGTSDRERKVRRALCRGVGGPYTSKKKAIPREESELSSVAERRLWVERIPGSIPTTPLLLRGSIPGAFFGPAISRKRFLERFWA